MLRHVGTAIALGQSAGRHHTMLRITVIESAAPSKTLKLEGTIAGTLVDEVRRLRSELLGPAASVGSAGPLPSFDVAPDRVGSLRRAKSNGQLEACDPLTLILDLSDVSFIDTDGIELMRELRRRNVVVTNHSSFLTELLKEVVPCS